MNELIALLFAIVYFGGPAVAWGYYWYTHLSEGENRQVLFWIVLIVMEITLFIILKSFSRKCPKCGKLNALKEIDRSNIGRSRTTIDEMKNIYNSKGEIVGSYDAPVPATIYTDKVHYQCRFCGFEKEQEKSYTRKD